MNYHIKEVNVKICKNLESDAPARIMEKVLEARAFLEGMIACGALMPGEYVISRKGLKGNGSGPVSHFGDRYGHYHKTGEFGHTFQSALCANVNPNSEWKGNHTNLWVNRIDGKAVFMTVNGNEKCYCALSTATRGRYSSWGM